MAKEIIFKHPEFEYEVRKNLGISDRPVTDKDVANIVELELHNFNFLFEDEENLSLFKNIETLDINTCSHNLDFLKPLTKLKDLYIEYGAICGFDFSKIEHLKKLENFTISGGDLSGMELINTDALLNLPNLKILYFHEFGSVDLSPLRQMEQLEFFFCGYADEVRNIDTLKYLTNLNHLELIDIEVDNLNFLDNFPDDIEIELSLDIKNDVDLEKLKRFKKLDLYDTYMNGKPVVLK